MWMIETMKRGVWAALCLLAFCVPGLLCGGLVLGSWKWAGWGAALNLSLFVVSMIFVEQLLPLFLIPSNTVPGGLEAAWKAVGEASGLKGARLLIVDSPELLFLPVRALGGRGLLVFSRSHIGLSSETSLARDLRLASQCLTTPRFWIVSFTILALLVMRSISPLFWDRFFSFGLSPRAQSQFTLSFASNSGTSSRLSALRFVLFLLFLPPAFCLIELGKALASDGLWSGRLGENQDPSKLSPIAMVLPAKNLVNIFGQR